MFARAVTLGRIATIPIRVHWSWLVIFGLLIIVLRPIYAVTVCGSLYPCGLDIAFAVAIATLIGISVLLHELGHALAARWVQVPVSSITLFAFGGVAEVEAEAPNPGADFAIAIAGPAVSLLIALIAGIVWWLGALPVGPLPAFAIVAAHLAATNAMLGIFNLLPGYPMDGGRVLRSLLWFLNDQILPATQQAARVGRACGIFLGLGGLSVGLAVNQPLVALWSVMVGIFLFRIANSSYRQALLQAVLHNVTVSDLMQRRFRTLTADLTAEQFVARYLLGQSETAFAVVSTETDDQEPTLVGMMGMRNLRRVRTEVWANHQVADLMTPRAKLTPLTPDAKILDALALMHHGYDEPIPVLDGPHLVGLLRRRDVALFVQVQLSRKQMF
jgi:Zn-dependent protease/CBS domain-containing protein